MTFEGELSDLYQQVILDHSKHPRNAGSLDSANRRAVGHNPLCGDQIVLMLEVKDGVIADVKFQSSGCAISVASASLMSEAIKGKTVQEAELMFRKFHEMLTGACDTSSLGKLSALSGTREFPMRVKCATLAWHTLEAALNNPNQTVTTESDA